jgi:hypothetical protein
MFALYLAFPFKYYAKWSEQFNIVASACVEVDLFATFHFWRFGLCASVSSCVRLDLSGLYIAHSLKDYNIVWYKCSPWLVGVSHAKTRSAAECPANNSGVCGIAQCLTSGQRSNNKLKHSFVIIISYMHRWNLIKLRTNVFRGSWVVLRHGHKRSYLFVCNVSCLYFKILCLVVRWFLSRPLALSLT